MLDNLFEQALRERLIGLSGRLEPRFLPALMERGCILRRGCRGLVHSRDPEILQAIERGDAFLSGLDSELWLRSPKDRI